MSYLDQVKDPKKNYKFGLAIVECKHEFTRDFSYGRNTPDFIPHILCLECGWHKHKGIEYTRKQWDDLMNSPNPEDPEYERLWLQPKTESVTAES